MLVLKLVNQKNASIASVSWALSLALLMLLPQDSFPESKLFSYDKLAHIAVFALFSFLLGLAWFNTKKRKTINTKLIALTMCLVYASLLEYLQRFVPGRMFDWYDFLANFTGGLVGVIIFSIFIRQKFVIDKLIL